MISLTPGRRKGAVLKKPVAYALFVILGLAVGVIVAGVVFAAFGNPLFEDMRPKPEEPSNTGNSELVAMAFSVAGSIRDGDYQTLSQVAHPELGVVFSPYATINFTTNKWFQAEHIAAFDTDTSSYVWGVYTGSGEPIELTVAEYFSLFVYDKDYVNATVIGVNKIVRTGNALENITDVFPDVRFVDFYVHRSENDDAEARGWSSLRLGFEEHGGSIWLTVILRSKWTV